MVFPKRNWEYIQAPLDLCRWLPISLVANTHPQVALDIWQSIVDGLIGQVMPKTYEEAADYLRLMEKVYSQNQRLADWQGLLAELRNKHKLKRRLIGTLDSLVK